MNRIIDPVHALKTANRDFAQLYARTSADELESVARAHTEFHRRLVDVLAARNPKVSRTELADVAAIVSAMFSTTVTSETLTGDPTKDLAERKRRARAALSGADRPAPRRSSVGVCEARPQERGGPLEAGLKPRGRSLGA